MLSNINDTLQNNHNLAVNHNYIYTHLLNILIKQSIIRFQVIALLYGRKELCTKPAAIPKC